MTEKLVALRLPSVFRVICPVVLPLVAASRISRRAGHARSVRRRVGLLKADRDTGRRIDAQVAQLVARHLHDGYFHHHLRLRLVEIFDQLLRHGDLVGSAAYHNRLLGRELLQPLRIQQRAQNVHQVLQLVGLRKIIEVERANDALFQLFALGRSVGGNEDRVGRDRTPEGLRLQRRNLQRLAQSDAVQINVNAARGVIGIEQNVDAGQTADAFVNRLRILSQVQRDGRIRDWR